MGGEPTQQLWFREVPLWGLDPEPWWEEVPGLMALYPRDRPSLFVDDMHPDDWNMG